MATTLAKIRFTVEQSIKDTLDPQDVLIWCNDAQTELMLVIELPSAATIPITNEDLSYPEPADIRRINRLWLSSERAQGLDRDIPKPYRRYNGQIIFETRFPQVDTLNIEFYRHLTYFTTLADVIDLEDRYATLYTSYCQAQYYDLPHVIDRLGEQAARRQYDKHYGRHLGVKDQIAIQYLMQSQPSTIKEAW